jgi:hypothetical protein
VTSPTPQFNREHKLSGHILYNQRDATYTMPFIIIISALHVSGGFFRPSSGAYKTVCSALGIVMLSCCLPLVDSRKALQYPKLHIQFYKPLMMGGENARTFRALIIIKDTV